MSASDRHGRLFMSAAIFLISGCLGTKQGVMERLSLPPIGILPQQPSGATVVFGEPVDQRTDLAVADFFYTGIEFPRYVNDLLANRVTDKGFRVIRVAAPAPTAVNDRAVVLTLRSVVESRSSMVANFDVQVTAPAGATVLSKSYVAEEPVARGWFSSKPDPEEELIGVASRVSSSICGDPAYMAAIGKIPTPPPR